MRQYLDLAWNPLLIVRQGIFAWNLARYQYLEQTVRRLMSDVMEGILMEFFVI
jgi:hypothetical protein